MYTELMTSPGLFIGNNTSWPEKKTSRKTNSSPDLYKEYSRPESKTNKFLS